MPPDERCETCDWYCEGGLSDECGWCMLSWLDAYPESTCEEWESKEATNVQ